MDALEEVATSIYTSSEPYHEFFKYQELLTEFLDFVKSKEPQHEIEEEKVLLPLVKELIDPQKNPEVSIDRMIRDHHRSKELIQDLDKAAERLHDRSADRVLYQVFTKRLHELVWHYRRHIEEENSFIIPLADQMFQQDSAT
jgi:hemerythrin-like domain-containing protein